MLDPNITSLTSPNSFEQMSIRLEVMTITSILPGLTLMPWLKNRVLAFGRFSITIRGDSSSIMQ